MINLSIIGKGFGQKGHNEAFKLFPNDINILGVYNGKEHNIIDIIKKSDAISIALPPFVSFPIIKTAIENDKHVFTEKPLSLNYIQALEIQKLLNQRSNIIHAINFEISESKAIHELKDILDKQTYGSIKRFECEWKSPCSYIKHHDWKHNIDLGGGTLNNFGSHILHLFQFLFKENIQSFNQVQLLPNKTYNTQMNANIKFNSFDGNIKLKIEDKINNEFTLYIHCKEATLILENHTDILKHFSLYIKFPDFEKTLITHDISLIHNIDGRIELTSSIIKKFINGIKNNQQISPNIYDGVEIQKMLDIIIREDGK